MEGTSDFAIVLSFREDGAKAVLARPALHESSALGASPERETLGELEKKLPRLKTAGELGS